MKSDESQSEFWSQGLRLKCVSCGRRRREPGMFFLSAEDLRALSRHLDLCEKRNLPKSSAVT